MMESDDLIPLGRVVGTHGIRGELRVLSYSGEFTTLKALRRLLLRGERGDVMDVALAGVRLHGGKALIRLNGYDDINTVESLVGRELVVYRHQLPEPDEGEYYWHDLLGLRVISETGEEFGTLVDIIETGSNDVYVVADGNREYLFPALEEVVREIDLAGRTMTVSPLEGLLDL